MSLALRILAGPLLFLLVWFGFHPDFTGLESLPATASADGARATAAVTVWMAAWWFSEAMPIPATSLLPIVLFPALQVTATREVTQKYADHFIFLFLGGFLIAIAMEKWNLHHRLALGVLRRMGASPRRLVLGFMMATAFISMWISNTATTLMMLPVALAVVGEVARSRGGEAMQTEREVDLGEEGRALLRTADGLPSDLRAFAAAMVLGVAYAANLGGLGTPVGTPPNLIFQQVYGKLSGNAVSFLDWMALGVPVVVISVPLCWWILMRPLPHLADWKEGMARRILGDKGAGAWSAGEKWVLGIFVTTAALWITRADVGNLQGWASRFGVAEFWEDSTVAIAASLLLFLIPVRTETGFRPLLKWSETGGLPWGSLLLLGAGFALSDAFQRSGLSHWMGGSLEFLSAVQGNPLAFPLTLLAILLTLTVLTEFASNTACAAILLPVLFTLGHRLGWTEEQVGTLMLAATMGCSNGFIAPAGTAPNAIAYATGYAPMGTFVRMGVRVDLLGIAVIGAVALVFS